MAAATAVSRPSSGGLLGEGNLGEHRSSIVCRRAALEVLNCGTTATTVAPQKLYRHRTLAIGEEAEVRKNRRTSRSCHASTVRQQLEEPSASSRLRDYVPNAWTSLDRQRPVLRRAATVQGYNDLLSQNSFSATPVSKELLVLPASLARLSPTAPSSERRTKAGSPRPPQPPTGTLVDVVAPPSTTTPTLAAAAAAAAIATANSKNNNNSNSKEEKDDALLHSASERQDRFALGLEQNAVSDPFALNCSSGLELDSRPEAPKAVVLASEAMRDNGDGDKILEIKAISRDNLVINMNNSSNQSSSSTAPSENSGSPVAEPIRKKGRITDGLTLPLPPRRGLESLDEDPHATPNTAGAGNAAALLPLRMPGAGALGPVNNNTSKKGTTGRALPARVQVLDDQTVMPKEIYNNMLKLGDAARGRLGRGQHKLAFAGTDGTQVLRLASATAA